MVFLLAALEKVLELPAAAQTNTAAYTWTTFAGYPGVGSADGVGGTAEFDDPMGVAVDKAGNIFVADTYNYTIREITPAGLVTTLAGSAGIFGNSDGTGSSARFSQPEGLAVDTNGNIYVADAGNNTIRMITPVGTNWVVTTIAGNAAFTNFNTYGNPFGGSADGTGTNAQFNGPVGIAVDSAGSLYVADSGNNTIRMITPMGTNWEVSTIAGDASITNFYGQPQGGYFDDIGANAEFNSPKGVTVDSAGDIFVVDTYNFVIRKIEPASTDWLVTTVAGSPLQYGSTDGTGTNAQFGTPTGITMDREGNLYVADSYNNTIRKMTLVDTNWIVSTLAGNVRSTNDSGLPIGGDADGTGTNALFSSPTGVAADGEGNVYVADSMNNSIRKIRSAGVVSTIAGLPGSQGSVDGIGNNARFLRPGGVAVDGAGNLYVADTGNNTIRTISSLAEVTTLAGLAVPNGDFFGITFFGGISPGTGGGSADGAGSNARFDIPTGVAADTNGNVFVADEANFEIRMITQGGEVSTIAGHFSITNTGGPFGTAVRGGNADGTGTNALFGLPQGVAVDRAGNVYVADTFNNTIRKVTLAGTNWVVTTIAGSSSLTNSGGPYFLGGAAGGSADGTGTNAQFSGPSGIAVDGAGNLFVADTDNNTIRKIMPVGTNWVVTTIAGEVTNVGYADGTGTNAQFGYPQGIAVDSAGNLYVADTYNDTIREIVPVGTNWVVTTIGGLHGQSGEADGAGSAAQFNGPTGIAVDSAGNIYVADTYNSTIRKGVFTAFTAPNLTPYTRPAMNSQLVVTLLPPEANGQWRFPWEIGWRGSGQAATNLATNNYPVEFRALPGWLADPPSLVVAVNGSVAITNQYYPTIDNVDTNNGGTLTVTLGPNPPAGAGWRFLGDSTPFYPSGFSTNLLPGTYLIEFAAVSGRVKPPNLSVQVQAGEPTLLAENYLLAQSAPAGVLLPTPVPPAEIGDVTDYPFGYDGQIQSDTDTGYGSGVAVEANVVLTAAHVVFDDQTLSYVSQAYWYLQREAGVFESQPLAARGWYVLSGYAAQRTNDLQIYSPDTSTPQSRNYDVAALYFLSPVAGGGFGGYLPSDATPNQWLTGPGLKMLVGYPVDGSQFGDATIIPGQQYQTSPRPYPLTLAADPVVNQQVYTAPWFLGYPGNSGGPLYVQFNGYYYPAGVYLGTLYNGIVPYASAVRAIDSQVASLIAAAQNLGDTGTNTTGGGVITIIPNQAINASNPGYLQWQLEPPSAVAAGAGWKIVGDPAYSSSTNYTRALLTTNAFAVQFKPLLGWRLPTNQTVTVLPGQIATPQAFYTVSNPVLVASRFVGLGITGTTGTTYRLESCGALSGGAWVPVSTNTIVSSGFNLLLAPPFGNQTAAFYRVVWLP